MIYRTYDRLGEGKIKSIGVSNFEIRHIEELKGYATIPPSVNQCEFHPHLTRNELREYCKMENIFFQVSDSVTRIYHKISHRYKI